MPGVVSFQGMWLSEACQLWQAQFRGKCLSQNKANSILSCFPRFAALEKGSIGCAEATLNSVCPICSFLGCQGCGSRLSVLFSIKKATLGPRICQPHNNFVGIHKSASSPFPAPQDFRSLDISCPIK